MTYTAEITRIEDGKVALYKFEDAGPIEDIEYHWSDGNNGCDCNRAILFCRALGLADPYESPCGDTLFSVRIMDEDGNVVYEDPQP